MNKIAKRFFKQRLTVLIILLVISIIATLIFSGIYKNRNIVKSDLSVFLDKDTEKIFKNQFDNKKAFYKYYNYEITSDSKSADFVFTSNIQMIDTSKDYSIVGYSPLVVCLKNTKNLNNYLKTTTKQGFLTCTSDSEINNDYSDKITCNFSRIIEAVLNGEDWSDLGGEDKKITIYCPEANSADGDLFYDFLLITINNGKYPTDNLEQIKEKANMFLASPNTIQTDVKSKISKLGGNLQDSDIYVLFEADLISASNGKGEISVTYPEITVVKQLYMQYNNLDIKNSISQIFADHGFSSNNLNHALNHKFVYRSSAYPKLNDTSYNYYRPRYFNIQEGFNSYELTN